MTINKITIGDLRKLFLNPMKDGARIDNVSDIFNIGRYVQVFNRMDREKQEYYLEINLKELSESNIDEDTIHEMVEQGWKLSKDGSSIINIC